MRDILTRATIGLIGLICTTTYLWAGEPAIPAGAKPLTGAEIMALLDGKDFSFTGYDQPIEGTTHWDAASQTVSGSYVWNKTESGNYTAKWFIDGDRNCTQAEGQDPVCQTIYRTETGFMEVNAKGGVHAVSLPAH